LTLAIITLAEINVSIPLVKQLAYYVTMYSPLPMAADISGQLQSFSRCFSVYKDVALDWDSCNTRSGARRLHHYCS
jgi:hypothetical protein